MTRFQIILLCIAAAAVFWPLIRALGAWFAAALRYNALACRRCDHDVDDHPIGSRGDHGRCLKPGCGCEGWK